MTEQKTTLRDKPKHLTNSSFNLNANGMSVSAPNRNDPGLDPIEMSPSGAGVGRSGGERKRTVAEPNPRAARSHTGRLLRLHGWFAAGL